MISFPSSSDPLAVLPSPPTSPTSPRTAATSRVRVKASRRPGSLGNVTSTASPERYGKRTESMSPGLSRSANANPDAHASEGMTIAPASAVAGKRRNPSITYYTSASPSPRSRPLSRTFSSGVDRPRDGEPVLANGKESVSQRSSLALGSLSPSTRESVCSSDGAVGGREREPLTLVEKHADLLHFIAQKERKCLELRDQLAVHEKELAELKRRWERIVNRGYDPLSNPPLAAGLGGVALDGLKEGVRMIAAGFSDLGGAIQELDSSDTNTSKPKSFPHPLRENSHSSSTRAKRTDTEHLSRNSVSSIQDGAHSSGRVLEDEDGDTIATAPSLSRAGSLNRRMHRRASRATADGPPTPASASVPSSAQKPTLANLDVGALTGGVTSISPLSTSAASASAKPAPKLPVLGSAHGVVPINTGPVSWMDSMGRKLSELQRGQTFSKGQKRASLLLDTIASALSPGPIATTPAPAPPLISTTTTKPRILSSTPPASTKPFLTTPPPSSPFQSRSQSRPYPSYKAMTDWLEDEEEQQANRTDGASLSSDSKQPPRAPVSVRMTGAGVEQGEAVLTTAATATAMSSFEDDDDWNW